jgi:hypothetical protein
LLWKTGTVKTVGLFLFLSAIPTNIIAIKYPAKMPEKILGECRKDLKILIT